MDFFGVGPWEALLILVVALIFVGPGKIVDFARTAGKWTRAIKRAGSDFTSAVTREIEKAGAEPKPSPNQAEKLPPPPLIASEQTPGAVPGSEAPLKK